MAAPQLNFPKNVNRFITVNYQSNDYLNKELDGQAKKYITEKLIEKIDILAIHSYIHGQIIIEVSSTNVVSTLKKVVSELAKPLAAHSPALHYSVDLASNSSDTPAINWLYVFGSDDMNKNFLESIKDIWPKKK